MLLELKSVEFAWPGQAPLLHIPEFGMTAGEHVFLKGPSGSGKSTLLGLIAGVLTAQSGEISFDGQDLTRMSNAQRDKLRARDMGVIFQLFNLLPYLDLLSNVALPCRLSAERRKRAESDGESVENEARRLLSALGLSEHVDRGAPVSELSVGQQQRVAAARALIGLPKLIIADEPTSAVDTEVRNVFIELLKSECQKTNTALLFVSHDPELASQFDRVVNLDELNSCAKEPA